MNFFQVYLESRAVDFFADFCELAGPRRLRYILIEILKRITVDFTKRWPRQLRDWFGIWEL
jgi:hypothetical protein